MTSNTTPPLDVEGAKELWMRLFDVTKEEADRLYDESWNKTSGWWSAYKRVRSAAGSLGVGSVPAGFDRDLLGDGWAAGLGGALARLARPLIGVEGGITQEDYDLVSRPWSVVIGQVHPDDVDLSLDRGLVALIREFDEDGDIDVANLATFLSEHGVIVTAQ